MGWYATDAALKSAHPAGQNGQWAIIGSTDTIWTWDSDTSTWKNTSVKTDLSNYYTKEQVDGIYLSKASVLDLIYPVGSIYMSAGNVSPKTFLGGTWQQIQGRFLLAADGTYPAGSTGGEAAHTLTQAELPYYTLPQAELTGELMGGDTQLGPINSYVSGIVKNTGGSFGYYVSREFGTNNGYNNLKIDATHSHSSGGSSYAHNNMPPYLAVYMWQRIA